MRRSLAIAAVTAVAAFAGAGLVTAAADDDPMSPVRLPAAHPERDDDDRPLWPGEERKARAAALAVTGGGTVTELDRSDDPGEAYEVEVVQGGREVDVALDLDFRPVPNRRYGD